MGIVTAESLQQWNYFMALESDLERLSRYVEFTDKNFSTFSIEIAHLFLAAASEVDVVAKDLCASLDKNSKAKSIDRYRQVITNYYPDIGTYQVMIPRHGLTFTPWENWASEKSPLWWTSHNKVKHQRNEFYEKASLKNALNCMAALFLLDILLYLNRGVERLDPPPVMFNPPRELGAVMSSFQARPALFLGRY